MKTPEKNWKGATSSETQPRRRKVSSSAGPSYRISELFSSVQGEGRLTGTPSYFVRISGCNLRCWFCDTPYASSQPEGGYLSLSEIGAQTDASGLEHVVLTGGEPFIYRQLAPLCERLQQAPVETHRTRHLTIETAGTIYHPVSCDLISISPKLAGSGPADPNSSWARHHERRREQLEVIVQLMSDHDYQLKFVVDCVEDAESVIDFVDRLAVLTAVRSERVLLMPQGTSFEELQRQADWLVPWCERNQLTYCPRAHIGWFGNRRGT